MARYAAQGATLGTRVAALSEAADQAGGRAGEEVITRAQQIAGRVDQRLAFSGEDTVIALAGTTGSGKSSLFNAIVGDNLAETSVKRPTTKKAMAAYWGEQLPSDLLDWLDVPVRHVVTDQSADLTGLVLLDLPDLDSIEFSHRVEVSRLVELVDMLIWVVDPQKYADNVLHSDFLRPLADHADVMMVVLNQVDLLAPDQRERATADLRRLLDSEGLHRSLLLAASSATGYNIPELRKRLATTAHEKRMAADRLTADVTSAARALRTDLGDAATHPIPARRVEELDRALAQAAGISRVGEGVLRAVRYRGAIRTGWPMLSWIHRLRPDPLRRLHVDRLSSVTSKLGTTKDGGAQPEPVRAERTGLGIGTDGVEQARVASAVRALSDDASEGMPHGWVTAVRRASLSHADTLDDDLDRAVGSADLGMNRGTGWWRVIQVLQWIIFALFIAGALWLVGDLVLSYLRLPPLPDYRWRDVPMPTWLLVFGVAAGLVLAGLSRIGVEVAARAKAARARAVLTAAVSRVAREAVVHPINAELERYRRARAAVDRALA